MEQNSVRTQGDEMNKKKYHGKWPLPDLHRGVSLFDVSFMVWVMLGPLAPFLSEMLKLTPYQKGCLQRFPFWWRRVSARVGDFSASVWRRRTGLSGSLHVASADSRVALRSYDRTVLFSWAPVGIGGASFAVALPIAGRWYPPEYQGP